MEAALDLDFFVSSYLEVSGHLDKKRPCNQLSTVIRLQRGAEVGEAVTRLVFGMPALLVVCGYV